MIFLLNYWKYIVMGVLLAAVFFYRWDAERWERKYYTFVAEVKVIGEAAKKAAKEREAEDKSRKEKADAQNAKSRRDLDGIYTAYRSLRDQRSGSGGLPEAPPGSRRPELACFNRAELAGSVGILEEGVPRITEQGDAARLDLDSAKAWAQGK